MSNSCVSETIVDRRNKKVETEREGDNYKKKDHPQGALLLRLRAASSIMCFKTQLEGSEKTLTIDGQKYTAKYKYTRPGFIHSTFMYDFYSGDYGGFLIDDKSGKLCGFGHPHTDPAYTVEEVAGKVSAERYLRDVAHRKAEEKIEAVIDSQKDIHIVGHSTTRRDALLIMFDGRCFYCMDYAVDIDLEDRTSSAALVLFYAVD